MIISSVLFKDIFCAFSGLVVFVENSVIAKELNIILLAFDTLEIKSRSSQQSQEIIPVGLKT